MSISVAEWMHGNWDGKVYYNPAEWMKCDWNGDFFYELSKLGDIGCIKFCMDMGLVSKRYECPKCGGNMKVINNERWLWVCRNSSTNPHYIKRSLKAGTFFQKTHLSFGLLLRLTYAWINKMPKESIMNDLGVATSTESDWKNFCREICLDHCLRFDGQVGGDGYLIDIYDAWLSEPNNRIERKVKGPSVFVGLVRNLNDCFVEVVEDRSAEVLVEIIIKRVIPGSIIILNSVEMYNSSHSIFEQLEVVHNVTIKSTHRSTDGTWSVVKRALQGNDSHEGEFNGEVAEHIWRRQHNLLITEKVQSFLKTVAETFPLKTKD